MKEIKYFLVIPIYQKIVMENTVIKTFTTSLLILLSLTFCNGQSVKENMLFFEDPINKNNEFNGFFSYRFDRDYNSQHSITLIMFKVYNDGHIDSIKNWGDLDKNVESQVYKIIMQSEPCWKFRSNSSTFKFVIFPFFNGSPSKLSPQKAYSLYRSVYEQLALIRQYVGSDFSNIYLSYPKKASYIIVEE
jgi:hypothetical protein